MTEIPRRTLGRTGLEVSTLGYGAMELRGAPTGPDLSDDDAAALLNELLDAGVNFIDTSIDYGRSEDVIGDLIAHRRDEYVLASKCGCVPGAPQGSDHVHTAELPDMVCDGYNGLLVPPRDAEALAEAMSRLIVSDELRKSLAGSERLWKH